MEEFTDSEKKNIIKQIVKKLLFIVLIVILYNTFLITKSTLDETGAKEIFGYKAFVITTDSMNPNLKIGDVVIIETVREEKLMVGDIITMQKLGEIITHRIVEILDGEKQREYITKGDNNTVEDLETIVYSQIEGKKVLKIPFLGNIILLLRNKVYVILLGISIFIICYTSMQKYKRKKMRREKKLYYTGG